MTFEEILEIVEFLRRRSESIGYQCSFTIEDIITIKIAKWYCCCDQVHHIERHFEILNRKNVYGGETTLLTIHEEEDVDSHVYANLIYTFLEKAGYLKDFENLKDDDYDE